MNEILLLLLGFIGVVAVGCSIALVALGTMIDQFPTGDESKRSRSIASPAETTKIVDGPLLDLLCSGGVGAPAGKQVPDDCGYDHPLCHLSFHDHRPWSSPLLSSIPCGAKRKISGYRRIPAVQISPVIPFLLQLQRNRPRPVIRKRYNNPVTDFMLNALLKKE